MRLGRRELLAGLGALPLAGCSPLGSDHVPPRTPAQPRVQLPSIIHAAPSQGPALYLLEDRGLPLVSMAIVIPAGHRQEAPGQEGLASLSASMLLRGIDGGDRVGLLERYGELGTTPASITSASALGLRCTVQRDQAPQALRLLASNLHRATLDAQAFEIERRKHRDLLDAARGEPTQMAALGVLLGIQGVEPPVALLPWGTAQSLAAFEPEAVRQWLGAHLRIEDASFCFAGDVDRPEAEAWIDQAREDWPAAAGPPPAPPPRPEPAAEGPRVVQVPWPRMQQAVLAFGSDHHDYGHRDEPAQELAGSLLAGLVHYELRTRQRTSYGVQSSAWGTKRGPVRVLYATLDGADLGRAYDRIFGYLQRLSDDVQVRASAIEALRVVSTMDVLDGFHGPEIALAQLVRLAASGLPVDTPATRVAAFEGLDAEQVTRAMRRAFDPDHVCFGVVGSAKALETLRPALRDRAVVERSAAQLLGLG